MGCGSSKVSDVSRPVPLQAETDVNDKTISSKRDAGVTEGLKLEGSTQVDDKTELIADYNKVNINNRSDYTHDVNHTCTIHDQKSKGLVEGQQAGKDGVIHQNDQKIVKGAKLESNGPRQKFKPTHTNSSRQDKTTNANSKNNSESEKTDVSNNVKEKTPTESIFKRTGKETEATSSIILSTDRNKDVGSKNSQKDQQKGLADNAKEGKARHTESIAKQKDTNELAGAKKAVISTNKTGSDANSTKKNDKVVANDIQNGKTTTGKSPAKTSTNTRSSSISTTSSDPTNSLKKTVDGGQKQQGKKRSVISQPKWLHDYDIPIIDPEEGLGELPEIYKSMEQPIKIEDTFWSGKREVIPDFQVMRDIDKHAVAAPKNIKTDLKLLVQYLVKPAKNDVGKYRAIARWIGQNIAYDVDVYFSGIKRTPCDPQSVLKKGATICAGYSNLFQAMCKEVSLDCDVITGKAKGLGYSPGSDSYENHAWNKIVIENKPYLCDVTWGAGAVGPGGKFRRLWKEHEFLADPVSFSQSRLPVDLQNNSEVNESAQLCKKPFKSLKTWADLPHCGSMLQAVGATVSPNKGTIEAKTNEGEIRIKIPRLLRIYTTLKENSKNFNLKENHVMILWEDDTAVLRFALPGRGKYQLSVAARFVLAADEEIEQLTSTLVSYCIDATGTQTHPPFPLENGKYYGNSPYTFLKGYQCLSHDNPVVATNSHRVIMQFACPNGGKAFFRLSDSSKKKSEEGTKVDNCLYLEKFPNKFACYIFLPKPGNYLLEQLTITEDGKETYQVRATFIIKFKGKIPTITAPFPSHTDWGTRKIFIDNNFTLMNIHGSAIRLNDGEGLFSFRRPITNKKDIIANVVTMQDVVPQNSAEWIVITKDEITSDTEQVNITIVLPKAGFYGLNLFIDRQFAGRFLISSDAKVSRNRQEKS